MFLKHVNFLKCCTHETFKTDKSDAVIFFCRLAATNDWTREKGKCETVFGGSVYLGHGSEQFVLVKFRR